MITWVVLFLITIFYVGLMLNYLVGWNKLSEAAFKSIEIKTLISVIIPARNESANIANVLQAVLQQNFPKNLLEIIVVDDHSTDDTAMVANEILSRQNGIAYQILHLADIGKIENAYKKKAIELAIQKAKGDFIVTTDADCMMPANWLYSLVSHYEATQHKLIAAPVKYTFDDSFFQQFQALDFIGLIGITGASLQQGFYNMCNGANLCYERKAFYEVNGFKGNDNISSGDDMFLMHKIAEKYPTQISFLKSNEACVITHPKQNWKEFLHQRLRWTSKSTSYADKRITAILVMVYLFNCSIIGNALLGFIQPCFFYMAITQLLIKSIVDFIFLNTITAFFQQKRLMKIFLSAQLIHVFYVIGVGLIGQFGSFNWKGRNFKK